MKRAHPQPYAVSTVRNTQITALLSSVPTVSTSYIDSYFHLDRPTKHPIICSSYLLLVAETCEPFRNSGVCNSSTVMTSYRDAPTPFASGDLGTNENDHGKIKTNIVIGGPGPRDNLYELSRFNE